MQFHFSFSSKNIILRMRAFSSFARIVRWGLVAVSLFLFGVLILDIFIFYRYSYRVVNLRPEPVVKNVKIDRGGLRRAIGVLDARAEKFKALYGDGTTTPYSR